MSAQREIKEMRVGLCAELKKLGFKIDDLRTDLQRDLKAFERRLTIKVGVLSAISVGIVAALVKLL